MIVDKKEAWKELLRLTPTTAWMFDPVKVDTVQALARIANGETKVRQKKESQTSHLRLPQWKTFNRWLCKNVVSELWNKQTSSSQASSYAICRF